jgi:hypothetical protein
MAAAPLHGTSVAVGIDHDGPLCGVLITGPSGAGKSRLALELIETCPFVRTRLISDDLTEGMVMDGRVRLGPFGDHEGLVERRGIGLTRTPYRAAIWLRAAVRLGPAPERLPQVQWDGMSGMRPVPLLHINAAWGLRTALRTVIGGHSLSAGLDRKHDMREREPS